MIYPVSIMMQIFIMVVAMMSELYTSRGLFSKAIIRFASGCFLLLSIFISLLLNEKMATSAPEKMNVRSSRPARIIKGIMLA